MKDLPLFAIEERATPGDFSIDAIINSIIIPTNIFRMPEYVGSEPVQRATWLNVMIYSAEQGCDGRIEGARKWGNRQWEQTCGVTLAEVGACSPLLEWDGDDLCIWNYQTLCSDG